MAAEKNDSGLTRDDVKDLLGSVKSLAESTAAKRKIGIAEASKVTPWNPDGGPKKRLKVTAFYMNGARVNPVMLTNEEIDLINQLKPGAFNKKKWVVRKRRDKSIELQYPNKSVEHRIELRGEAGNLAGMLKKILTEHEAQLEKRRRGEFEDDED